MACPLVSWGTKQIISNEGFFSGVLKTPVVALPGTSGKFVTFYRVTGTGWIAIVGTRDANGGITYGTPVTFDTGSINDGQAIGVSSDKVLLVYRDSTNDPASIVGTISGTSISFGSKQYVDTLYAYSNRVAVDTSTGKLLWIYSVSSATKAVAGTISGTTVGWGTPVQWIAERRRTDVAIIGIDANKYLYVDGGNANAGNARVFTVSGTVPTAQTENNFQATRISDPILAWSPTEAAACLACFDGAGAPTNQEASARVLTVSGNTVSVGTKSFLSNATGGDITYGSDGLGVCWDAGAGKFAVAWVKEKSTADDVVIAKAGNLSGTTIDFCPDDPAVVLETPPALEGEARQTTIAYTDNGPVVGWYYSSEYLYTAPLDVVVPSQLGCEVKPKVVTIEVEGQPGSPGHPGQPYVPAYCVPGYCVTIETTTYQTPNGTYEYRCVTEPTEESLVLGFPDYETVCTFFPIASATATDPYAPDYDPNVVESSEFSGSGYKINETCYPPTCYPEQNYIPPSPPQAPTPTEYNISYDLGWNYDVLIDTGSNITLTIDQTNVAVGSSGIAIGVSNFTDWGLSGTGKFPVFILFEGVLVSLVSGGSVIWAQRCSP